MEQHARPTTTDNTNFSPTVIRACDGQLISTTFTYKSVAYQNQANSIYQSQQAYNTANNASVTGKQFQFISHQDRIAALIGKYNQSPCTNN
jgi:hypothetical protein